jgi:hypothetical protein
MPSRVYRPKDIVRLTREQHGTPTGSEGEVIGWYATAHPEVLVRLWDGGVQRVPPDALELVRRAEAEHLRSDD